MNPDAEQGLSETEGAEAQPAPAHRETAARDVRGPRETPGGYTPTSGRFIVSRGLQGITRIQFALTPLILPTPTVRGSGASLFQLFRLAGSGGCNAVYLWDLFR